MHAMRRFTCLIDNNDYKSHRLRPLNTAAQMRHTASRTRSARRQCADAACRLHPDLNEIGYSGESIEATKRVNTTKITIYFLGRERKRRGCISFIGVRWVGVAKRLLARCRMQVCVLRLLLLLKVPFCCSATASFVRVRRHSGVHGLPTATVLMRLIRHTFLDSADTHKRDPVKKLLNN